MPQPAYTERSTEHTVAAQSARAERMSAAVSAEVALLKQLVLLAGPYTQLQ